MSNVVVKDDSCIPNGDVVASTSMADVTDTNAENTPGNVLAHENEEGDEDNTVRRSNRVIVHTEKGKLYQKGLLQDRISLLKRRVEQRLTILNNFDGGVDKDIVKLEVANVDSTLKELDNTVLRLLEVCDDEKERDHFAKMLVVLEDCVIASKRTAYDKLSSRGSLCSQRSTSSKVSEWLLRSRRETDSLCGDMTNLCLSSYAQVNHPNIDSTRKKIVSSISEHSYHSNNSVKSVEQKVKTASLKVEAKALRHTMKEQVEAEARRKEEAIKAQLSRLEIEIAKSEAVDKVYEQESKDRLALLSNYNLYNDHKGKERQCVHSDDRHHKKLQNHHYDDPYEKDSHEKHVNGNVSSEVKELSSAIVKLANMQSAPSAELDIFSGKNPLDYALFKTNFADVVERFVPDQRSRLNRLLRFTSHDAKELVESCVHLKDAKCFTRAKELLDAEYGNSFKISRSYLQQIQYWPKVKGYDRDGWKKLHRFLLKCLAFKKTGSLSELDHGEKIGIIISKLDVPFQDKWTTLSLKKERREKKMPNFEDLVDFIDFQSSVVNHHTFSRENIKSFTVNAVISHNTTQSKMLCNFCESTKHPTECCPVYTELSVVERLQKVYECKLCFGCLNPITAEHRAKSCPQRLKCDICQAEHPSSLHQDADPIKKVRFSPSLSTKSIKGCVSTSEVTSRISMCIVLAYVSHKDNPKRQVLSYVLLDNDCTACFASTALLEQIAKKQSRAASVSVETMNGSAKQLTKAVDGLLVRCADNHAEVYKSVDVVLPTTYGMDKLPFGKDEMASAETLAKWSYLQEAVKVLPNYDSDIPFGLMIGGNCVKALEPHQYISSKDAGPFAYRTLLGWCIVGPVGACSGNGTVSNFTKVKINVHNVTTGIQADHCFSLCRNLEETTISDALNKMYSIEFNEKDPEGKGMSRDDELFMRILDAGVHKSNGKYHAPLPFRSDIVKLPNNRKQALQRLLSIRRKMLKDPTFRKQYTCFMEKLITKGYARKNISSAPPGCIWYLPHHGVQHPTKSLRGVFDCSARFEERSLNDELLQGPDLVNQLLGVLIRFRKETVAFSADIEAMFCQIEIPEDQRSFLRFLWWPNGDINLPIIEYEMCVHVFGAISSPSCANFVMKRLGTDSISLGVDVKNTIIRDFYVDDLLKSSTDDDTAISLLLRVQKACHEGGFNLTKVLSNSRKVIESVPIEKRAPSVKQYDIGKMLPIERALGVTWYVEDDTLGFRISVKDSPLTRRNILATVSSIYDPPGLISPFLLKGRKILQEIAADKYGWDDVVESHHKALWLEWREELIKLKDLSINRCYKPADFGTVIKQSLHYFNDAHFVGYGNCTYLRQVNNEEKIHVSLVMGKSRVSPLKSISLPRLELNSCSLSAEIGVMVRKEIGLGDIPEIYWTDSKICIGYINNDTKRFRIYVANRVQKIRQYTDKSQWRYVNTLENPADHASRGISVMDDEKASMWFNGPKFLWQPEEEWQKPCGIMELEDDDPEVKVQVTANTTLAMTQATIPTDILTYLEENKSKWVSMVRIVARLLAFARRCQKKKKDTEILSSEFQEAEMSLIRMIQSRHFHDEFVFYKSGKPLPKRLRRGNGRLWRLDPYIDLHSVLRVGGRIRKSSYDKNVKHPVILPNKSIAVKRLIEHQHCRVGHSGRPATLNALRSSGFWILNSTAQVRQTIFNCVKCRKHRGKLGEQKMADLPSERTQEVPPFTHCGVDVFGPFYVKDGRKQVKRLVVLFTCLSCRGVHLETISNLSTDTFILALRRFLARRGPVQSMRSDNGTNFVGADNEFQKAFKEMDHEGINNFLVEQSCDWIRWERNTPEASHTGGVWERQIRTVRKVLTALLDEHSRSLNDESFSTLLTEAETIVNSRPLTVDFSDPSTPPVSPIQLLTLKSKVVLPPPGTFQKTDMYCRKRWRQVQHLANEFWTRWRKDYLVELQQRNKWTCPKRNFQVNDIVLLKDTNIRRQQWPMARVTKVFADGNDGLVRSVELKTSTCKSTLKRPIQKIVLLVEASDE